MSKCIGIMFYVTITIVVSNSDAEEQSNPLDPQFSSSLFKIVSLLKVEETVIMNIQRYVQKESIRLSKIKRWLNHFIYENNNALNNVEYVKNPINAFKIIKRLTRYLWGIESIIRDNAAYQRDEGLKLPTLADLRGAVDGISRIQQSYKLDVKDLAQGIVKGTYSENNKFYYDKTSGLNLDDCYILGRTMYEEQYYTTAIEWIKLALEKYDAKDGTHFYKFSRSDILSLLIYTELALGNVTDAEELYNTSPELAQDKIIQETITKYSNVKDDLPLMKRYSYQQPHLIEHVRQDTEHDNALCRGENLKRSRLTCYYNRGNPFLKLAPIKTELLSTDPENYMYYDVLSDREMEMFKSLGAPKLKPAGIYVYNSSTEQPANIAADRVRCSQGVWLTYNENHTIPNAIFRRFSDMTGHSMALADMQVVNYGIGGHFTPHVDGYEKGTVPDKEKDKGNRIASIIVWLSDVKQGGATIFPEIDLAVFPVRGAALLWYNLDDNGDIPNESEHAACPVLAGEKWTTIVVVHEYDQTVCNLKKYKE